MTQFYFKARKTLRLNATHYFIMKTLNKRELQQIASNHSSDIDFKDFIKLYKERTGWFKKAAYFVFDSKIVFYNLFPYFSGGVVSIPGRLI